MIKTGYSRIDKNRNGGPPAKCANCGGEGRFRVTFQDLWGKLIVTLCKDCATKKYEELKLQANPDWTAKA